MALAVLARPRNIFKDDSDWENTVLNGDDIAKGVYTSISEQLTNTKPVLKAGSVIDHIESLIVAITDQTLIEDSDLVDGIVHIKLVPTTIGTVDVYVTSDSIPEWSQDRNGRYNDEGHKFLDFFMTKSGTDYINKGKYLRKSSIIGITFNGKLVNVNSFVGDITFLGNLTPSSLEVNGNVTIQGLSDFTEDISSIGNITASGEVILTGHTELEDGCFKSILISDPYNQTERTSGQLFSLLSAEVPNVGDVCFAHIDMVTSGGTIRETEIAERISSTTISLYGRTGPQNIVSGGTNSFFVYVITT